MQSPPAASATLIVQKPKIKTRKEGNVAAPTTANAFDIMPETETKAGNVSKGIAKHFLKRNFSGLLLKVTHNRYISQQPNCWQKLM